VFQKEALQNQTFIRRAVWWIWKSHKKH